MPRSPTNTARFSPKRSRSLPTCAATVEGSDAFPGNASTATGRPSASHSSPKLDLRQPFLAVARVSSINQRAGPGCSSRPRSNRRARGFLRPDASRQAPSRSSAGARGASPWSRRAGPRSRSPAGRAATPRWRPPSPAGRAGRRRSFDPGSRIRCATRATARSR